MIQTPSILLLGFLSFSLFYVFLFYVIIPKFKMRSETCSQSRCAAYHHAMKTSLSFTFAMGLVSIAFAVSASALAQTPADTADK
jgi:hypothetical protein